MFKDHIETSVLQLICCKCNFVGETYFSLKKHINTKHEPQSIETNNKEEEKFIETDCVLDGIDDLFQIEIIEGEEVYACNVCDEGFDRNDEIRRHISTYHKEILTQINKEMNEVEESDQEDRSSDESYGDAWLAKVDDNKDLIG